MSVNINIEVIVPRELFNTRELERALNNATKGVLKAAKVDFDVTTQTWTNRPEFVIEQDGVEGEVSTDNKIYKFINDGTRKNYPITPKRGRFLRFREGYRAKTTPRIIASKSGGSFGPTVFRRRVIHPGITARLFDTAIAKKWTRLYPNTLQRAIDAELR